MTTPEALPTPPIEEVHDLPVQGMTCASCVSHVEKALISVDGVRQAEVNLITGRARITFDPSRATREAMVLAVEDAGYEVPPPPPEAPALPADSAQQDEKTSPPEQARAPEDLELQGLRRDLKVAAVLGIPLLVLAMSHGAIPGSDGAAGRWLQFALATPVMLGPGRRFFTRAWKALRHRTADMNSLVALGTGAAWIYSTVALTAPRIFPHGEHGVMPHLYFEASVAIIGFVLLGKVLEARAKHHLSDAVRGLVALQPPVAHRLSGRGEEDVPVGALRVGDRFVVRPGERVATDGEVLEGNSALDESMLTGESLPVDRGPGSHVTGGTLNQSGALVVKVTGTGNDTTLARIVEAVEQAQGSKAPVARLADRVSAVFVPTVLALAALAFVVWMALDPTAHGLSVALERFVAVLVIACPCALGLATPAAVAVGTGRGAELGILVKGGVALEAASHVDTVLVDKTGTLTTGKPVVAITRVLPGINEEELLSLAASAEQRSEHPVARALVDGARKRGLALHEVQSFRAEAGAGIEAALDRGVVRAGTTRWMTAAKLDTTDLEGEAEQLAAQGHTPIFVALDGKLLGLLTVTDRPAAEAPSSVKALQSLGIEVVMVTGDREGTARAIAAELGIERVFAGVRPEQKAAIVKAEQERGRRVAMVGDGINDAPALAAADVGVAMGTGSDIAAASAEIALLRGGIGSLPTALRLARSTLTTIRQNLFWAFVYNVIGIPIAAGVLSRWGLALSPVVASAAMSLSSVSVLTNSLRLRRLRA